MSAGRARIVDATRLPPYGMGADHPFVDGRLEGLYLLLHELGWLPEDEVLPPRPATAAELALAHTPEYVALQEALSDPARRDAVLHRAPSIGMGSADNPILDGLHEGAAAAVGATLACVEAVLGGHADHAFQPGGGLHHAMPARAAGFCVYNDLVVAIRAARARGIERVLYVDFDVHHGDGVEAAFAEDPHVLTLSFHETPEMRWPGTGWVQEVGRGAGRGYTVNLPFASGTGDASWLELVTDVLASEVRWFRPELIVSQHGCDTHREDPLADLALTTRPLHEVARLTHRLAHEACAGRWVATGGGGYRPRHVLPRAWAMVWAAMSGRVVPERLPESWRTKLGSHPRDPLPTTFYDPELADPREASAASVNRATRSRLAELLARARAPR